MGQRVRFLNLVVCSSELQSLDLLNPDLKVGAGVCVCMHVFNLRRDFFF